MRPLLPCPRPAALAPLVLFTALAAAPGWAARPVLSVQPAQVKPGDPLLVRVQAPRGALPVGSVGERPLAFVEVADGYLAVAGLPVEQPPGALAVRVTLAEGAGLEASVEVVEARYRVTALRVEGRYVDPPAAVEARIEADRAALARAFSQPLVPPLFREDFRWPRPGRVTASFGDQRTFNGELKGQHYGTDLDGRVGAPVHATNTGTVVLARDCYTSGRTVVVHHGAGLYSAYFHLSRIRVREGQRLRAGELLGQVGRTGRVTGPHLHWGVRADGLWVDGETLLALRFFPPAPPVR